MEQAIPILSVAISLIGLIVIITAALGGFAYKVLDGKIAEVKRDAKQDIDDEERRRKESISNVTQTVNDHYENLRRDIGEVKDDVKELRRETV